MEWKNEVLSQMGVGSVLELSLGDAILLLLYLGGEPIYGVEALHTVLFLYPYFDSGEELLLLAPYSRKVDRLLAEMEREGLVERRVEYRGDRVVTAFLLTGRGRERAKSLASRIRRSFVLLRGFAARRGFQVLEELESLKHTYNGLDVLEIGEKLSRLIVSGDQRVLGALGGDVAAYRLYAKAFLSALERGRGSGRR